MNQEKTGALILSLRKGKGLTQKELAEQIGVGDKAVSKWEHGRGCPDLSLLPELSRVLGVGLDALLSGELGQNEKTGGNMKKIQFYFCPDCGNLLTATEPAVLSCCGKKLLPLIPKKAEESERLLVERVETESFVSSRHEMTREHFITFVALLTGDTLVMKKQYPEWDLQTRLPALGHGTLFWHCSQHGLFYQLV